MSEPTVERTIAGRELVFRTGREFVAVKETAPSARGRLFNANVVDVAGGIQVFGPTHYVVVHATEQEADEFVDAFNDQVLTIKGRFWE